MKHLFNQIELELIAKAKNKWIKPNRLEETKKEPFWSMHDVREIISDVLSEWDREGRPEEWKRSVEIPL